MPRGPEGASFPDRVHRLTAYEVVSGEIIDALRVPLVCGLVDLDLAAAHAFRKDYAARTGQRLSDLALVVAAVSRALAEDPTVHTIYDRGRRIVPGAVDIGVSVAPRLGPLAPVAVVRDASRLTVDRVQAAIVAGGREAREREAKDAESARLALFVPGPLRRFLLRRALSSPRLRRRLVGTFQVSSLDRSGLEAAFTPVTAAPLLMLGHTELRPVVVAGEVRVRPRAWGVIHGDHRIMNASTAGAFRSRLQRILDAPERLLEAGASGSGAQAVQGALEPLQQPGGAVAVEEPAEEAEG